MQKIKQLFFVASVKNTSLKDSPSPSVIHLVYFYNKKYDEAIKLDIYKFSMYDVDGNGWIDLREMTRIVKSIYKMMGPNQVSI